MAELTEHQVQALARLRALPASALSAKQTKLLQKLASKETPAATTLKRPRDEAPAAPPEKAPRPAASKPEKALPKAEAVASAPKAAAPGFWQQNCEHGRMRSECGQCGGGGLCDHGRKRNKCKQCAVVAAVAPAATSAPIAAPQPAAAAPPEAAAAPKAESAPKP